MGRITQYSRISHHTTSGFPNTAFTIPASSDFTDGTWTIYDLALSEIGVNETDSRVFIRCDSEVKEFKVHSFYTASTNGSSTATMSEIGLTAGGFKKFNVSVKGVADTSPYETIVSELWGGLRGGTGSSISFTGGTYSTNSYRDFSSTTFGPQVVLNGLTASFIINGAPGYTVSWSMELDIQ